MKILFNLISNPMFYKSVGGKYLWCNKAFENALGLEREDIIRKTDYEITLKDIADLFLN
ncbi:PAS domain-containing protein [Clostridium saccharoperbutylacetonicum]|uniref:PAS domain-containing protein n=1 Tax=Clostridium saccharoperbutylacetonicum TaxID=36745 RepID=UPI0039E9229B